MYLNHKRVNELLYSSDYHGHICATCQYSIATNSEVINTVLPTNY